jgi:hypothetical protein
MYQKKTITLKIVLLKCLIVSSLFQSVQAQPLVVIAEYPLIENLVDSTGNNNNVFLEGNPTLPTLPTIGTSLCSNGIYIIDPGGQNIETPIMPTFDITNFQIEVEFNVTELPASTAIRPRMPIIMGSRFARWLGIYIDSSGNLGFKFNNDVGNYVWSNNAISGPGVWNSARITYLNGQVELFFNNQSILSQNVGPLNTFQNTFNFTVTDFSEGNPFNGCIRNLIISTSPDLLFSSGFE